MQVENFINGRFSAATSGETFVKLEPATGGELARVAASGQTEVNSAVAAAKTAFETVWRHTPAVQRAATLHRLADLIERDTEQLTTLLAREQGRPAIEMRMMDIPMSVDTLRYFAGWADKLEGRTIPTAGSMGRSTLNYTELEPVGVVAQIIPWNAPLMICVWKLAPALAAGCTVVIKPSEDAPVTLTHLMRLVAEAGIPDGVVNLVNGVGPTTGRALTTHPDVAKVSFTGSTEVGRAIARDLAGSFKPLTLELGGKAAQILLSDADVSRAIDGLLLGLFANQGQTCAAGSRILVHESIADAVAGQLAAATNAIRIGLPQDPETQMSSLINARQKERVNGYIQKGLSEGARMIAGGRPVPEQGFFVCPTLFVHVDSTSVLAQEEIFGPVGVIVPFSDDEDAVRIANSTRYALSTSLWTQDVSKAHKLARQIDVGAVAVNCWSPLDARLAWGGHRDSGSGHDLSRMSMMSYVREKTVTISL
ncbi:MULTISPECIES: aldehyde dehydrogenase [Paraburkholderia]|uniref:aldehyde dehydrogenase family protein n=1 Tax=Paraburkholderia TaxID=1822464 RepID=UPI002255F2A5|nr:MULTISPECIES: aldehyde dehydrogenase family protein [Paraburkholderia]MCX4163611.1 aldehyde dehydrogenase family protein [Paraburkholderia megapolitana]MDN7159106.1 aldehyde dehydrogenase family protein [Paraburkholderia sp. CHISQ3]MDQ6496153.1 aldehyde dehydrogenase family protein [Paraburkholderia megapolitana]